MTRDVVVLLMLISLSSCLRRDGRNSDCRWPGEAGATSLDLARSGDLRHLSQDAEFAEDLAIRYADANHGLDSGNFVSREASAAERNRCFGNLIGEIAKAHGVPPDSVSGALGKNRLRMDLVINLPFVLLFALLAYGVVVRLNHRYAADDSWAGKVMILGLTSFLFGLGGLLLGEQWSTAVEMVRLGNGHLGYRTDRVPWARFPMQFFVAGVAGFWLIAALLSLPRRRSGL